MHRKTKMAHTIGVVLEDWLQAEAIEERLGVMGVHQSQGTLRWTLSLMDNVHRIDVEVQSFSEELGFNEGNVQDSHVYQEAFGFIPKQVIVLTSIGSSPPDQVVLGRLALRFLDSYNGVVDIGGLVMPMSVPSNNIGEALERDRDFVKEFPGNAYVITSAMQEEGSGICHAVDREFLTAWLEHPDYRLP